MQPIAEKFLLNDFYFYGQSHQLFRVGRLGVCYGRREQGTEHGAQSTGRRAQGAGTGQKNGTR